MATVVIMPKFGMAQKEATIVRWLKGEGERVAAGEPLLEVTTDKVNMDVEAPASGVLRAIKYGPGEVVPVTEAIAYIAAPGETIYLPESSELSGRYAATNPKATPLARRVAEEKGVALAEVTGSGPGGRITRGDVEQVAGKVRATPAARRVAREAGMELSAIAGTGPKGRIQEADVRQAAAAPAAPRRKGTVIPLQGTRAIIARRMQQSYQTAPHIHLSLSADVTEAEAARVRWAGRSEQKISLTTLIVKACAWALRRHPLVNSTLEEDDIHLWDEINIGVAVALPEGLIVPVIRQADTKHIELLAKELQDLSERARQGKLRPDEVEAGTFTITNLGMFGIESFDPILNPPQSAILGVGRAVPTPVARDGQVVIRPVMQLTLAADHRVLDGAMAARFLQDVQAGLEDPTLLLL